MAEMKANGLNLLQTYVFWDIHEPEEGTFNFPTDPADEANLVLFLQEAQRAGLYVHLRIGPYSCAEWSNGGLPAWLLDDKTSVWRTDDEKWLSRIFSFVDKTLEVVTDAGLLHRQGGPIIMAQIENEYGNIESFYGAGGEAYVEKVADYALSKSDLDIPWVMCQQGEGTGTAPMKEVINACNGYYCDNWIEKHVADFPDQPHMFTENWPGWFQKWGEAVPHRPATDVAFSVARWFAKGGSFHNYYMAFGGTSFARHVGGPNIVTSYDYDVQINEYGFRAEPKFSLTAGLHNALYKIQNIVFANPTPQPTYATFNVTGSNCETQTYFDSDSSECVMFLSNIGKSDTECSFSPLSMSIPSWSVSIVTGKLGKGTQECSSDLALLYSTKGLDALPANYVVAKNAVGFEITDVSVKGIEKVPTLGSASDSDFALEQISVTGDRTDYLWYTSTFTAPAASTSSSLSFSSSVNGGVCYHLFVNGVRSGEKCGDAILDDFANLPVRFGGLTLNEGLNDVAILSVAMGLRNYGTQMETNAAGISGDVTIDGTVLTQFRHVEGMQGESGSFTSNCKSEDGGLTWYSLKLNVPEDTPGALALDLSTLGKGMVFANGKMLGRFWDKIADDRGCTPCEEMKYNQPYEMQRCRTGCGELSQTFYKLPTQWLTSGENEIVIFEERVGGEGVNGIYGVRVVEMDMELK
jgi:hypothetical protein